MDYYCAICERSIGGWSLNSKKQRVRNYFCRECFNTYRDDIINGSDWVLFLRRSEKNRRYAQAKQEKNGVSYITFSDILDISNDGMVVFRKRYG